MWSAVCVYVFDLYRGVRHTLAHYIHSNFGLSGLTSKQLSKLIHLSSFALNWGLIYIDISRFIVLFSYQERKLYQFPGRMKNSSYYCPGRGTNPRPPTRSPTPYSFGHRDTVKCEGFEIFNWYIHVCIKPQAYIFKEADHILHLFCLGSSRSKGIGCCSGGLTKIYVMSAPKLWRWDI